MRWAWLSRPRHGKGLVRSYGCGRDHTVKGRAINIPLATVNVDINGHRVRFGRG